MKLIIFLSIVVVSLSFYFIMELYFLPEQYLALEQPISQPFLDVIISDSEISLGDSFNVEFYSKNIGDISDALLVSTSFPEHKEIKNKIKIVSYDFTESPHWINVGDEIGFEYLPLQKTTDAKYPIIEAYSRPAKTGEEYHMVLMITPGQTGNFVFYTKSITFPHLTSLSHFPSEGTLDHQGEFVKIHSVKVNP